MVLKQKHRQSGFGKCHLWNRLIFNYDSSTADWHFFFKSKKINIFYCYNILFLFLLLLSAFNWCQNSMTYFVWRNTQRGCGSQRGEEGDLQFAGSSAVTPPPPDLLLHPPADRKKADLPQTWQAAESHQLDYIKPHPNL